MFSKFFKPVIAAFCFALISFLSVQTAFSADRHAGYYYPVPQTFESYISPLPTMPSVTKRSRIGLIVGLNEKQLSRHFASGYHMFAKGEVGQKLIVVAVDTNRYQTLYQLRALLAAMSSMARTSPLFAKSGAPENLNFLDLCKMAGFTQVTLSNGVDISHRIDIK